MWYLKKAVDCDGYHIYLPPFEEITFGRKKGKVPLINDESISRIHASIYVQPKNDIKADEPTSKCIIKDKRSKYGTYIIKGDEKIEVTEEGCLLNNQDIIRLGVLDSMFSVTYVPIITVVSSLNNEDKSTLQNLMDHIDGMISTEWTNNCTHLTVSNATLTEKVTWALASAIPIVTINYWVHVKEAMENNEEIPKPHNFIPLIGESLVDKTKFLLRPNEKRKTLFRNLIFVHFSMNQYKIYGKMIHLAGGKSLLYWKKPLVSKELCSQNVIVLQYPGDETTQATQQIVPEYSSICKALQQHGRKLIPESEIPLAILHCSVEKFCNPKFRFSSLIKRSEPKPDTSEVLVLDTQDVGTNTKMLPEVVSVMSLKSNIALIAAKNPQIIPETNDTFSSQDSTTVMPVDQPPRGPACSTPLANVDKFTKNLKSNVLTTNSQQNVKATLPKEDAICIPETYDSFVVNVMSSAAHSMQCTINLSNDEIHNAKTLTQQPMEVDNKSSIEEIIDLSEDEKSLPSTNEGNGPVKKVPASKGLDTLSKKCDTSTNKSPKTNVKNTSDDRSVAACSPDIIVHNSDDDYATDVGDDDEHICRKNKMEKMSSNSRKRKFSDGSDEDSSVKEVSVVCSCSEREENEASSNIALPLTTNGSTTNFKRFKKAPVLIPEKRIGLDDLCVWQKSAF